MTIFKKRASTSKLYLNTVFQYVPPLLLCHLCFHNVTICFVFYSWSQVSPLEGSTAYRWFSPERLNCLEGERVIYPLCWWTCPATLNRRVTESLITARKILSDLFKPADTKSKCKLQRKDHSCTTGQNSVEETNPRHLQRWRKYRLSLLE